MVFLDKFTLINQLTMLFCKQFVVFFGSSLNLKRINQLFIVILSFKSCRLLQISQSFDFVKVLLIVNLQLLLNLADLLLELSGTFLALGDQAIYGKNQCLGFRKPAVRVRNSFDFFRVLRLLEILLLE